MSYIEGVKCEVIFIRSSGFGLMTRFLTMFVVLKCNQIFIFFSVDSLAFAVCSSSLTKTKIFPEFESHFQTKKFSFLDKNIVFFGEKIYALSQKTTETIMYKAKCELTKKQKLSTKLLLIVYVNILLFLNCYLNLSSHCFFPENISSTLNPLGGIRK